MAHQDQPGRIATIACCMTDDPAHCRSIVLEKRRITDLRHQPVVRDSDQKSARRQRPADKGVTVLRPGVPRPAVEEDNHGQARIGCARFWPIEIEPLPRIRPEADVTRRNLGAVILWDQ